jgi:hypothetical protein
MKKISERFRKSLRTVFRGIGVSVVSLIIQACYGPMPPSDLPYTVDGEVKAKETGTPILGIKVYDKDSGRYAYTNEHGHFRFRVEEQESYTIIFKDIDGEENGGQFKQKTKALNKNEINNLLICLEEDTGTDEE